MLSMKPKPIGVPSTTLHALSTSVPLSNGHEMPLALPATGLQSGIIYYVNDIDRARLLALKATHSSDWHFALPISSCGLHMCDETIRVAVGLHLGLNLCEAHTCPCSTTVSPRGTHGLSCKMRYMAGAGKGTSLQGCRDFI